VYRDEKIALAEQNQQLTEEVNRIREENEAMRIAIMQRNIHASSANEHVVYDTNVRMVSPGDRVAYGQHQLRAFSPWAAMALHFCTLGIWSMFHFGRMHGSLPKLRQDDPDMAKSVWMFWVPYVNLWWMFFSPTRLIDRINFQYLIRGRQAPLTKTSAILAGITSLLFYFVPLVWLVAIYQTQKAVNELVALGAVQVESYATTGVRVEDQFDAFQAPGQTYNTTTASLADDAQPSTHHTTRSTR
jgi:hypothetical protein